MKDEVQSINGWPEPWEAGSDETNGRVDAMANLISCRSLNSAMETFSL